MVVPEYLDDVDRLRGFVDRAVDAAFVSGSGSVEQERIFETRLDGHVVMVRRVLRIEWLEEPGVSRREPVGLVGWIQ